jgi:hypothetical protein
VLDYTDSQNGFATKASVGYLYGAPLGVIGSAQPYDSLGVFQAGIQTTYMGVTVGGNVKAGTVQDGYALTPKGGRHAVGYTLGASYANGPIMVGGSFFDEQSAGKWASGGTYARTLSEYGLNVGANYTIAKPLSLFVDGMYFHDHQPSATNGTNAQGELVSVGTTIKW